MGGEPRITSWFLACAGREQDWPHELRESVAELAADVALERARLDAARAGDQKLAEAIVRMLGSGGEGAAPAEIASLMRAAGLPPDGRYVVIALAAAADRVTGPNAGRWRGDLAAELVLPLAAGAVAAPLGEEIILLVPAPEGPGPEDAGPEDPAHLLAARIRDADPVVAADRSRIRVTAGVSALAAGLTALGGALQEAGSARRLAALRGPAAVAVVTSDEVASHELLLAAVPPACSAPSGSACSARCWPTTTGTGRSCCRRCGSSWPARGPGTRARRRCTSTSTRCGTGSGGSRS